MAISDFSDCLTSTVNIAPVSSKDSYGKPTYGADVPYSARISERRVKVRDAQGEEVVADGKIVLGTSVVVPLDSRITLPDSSTPVIIAVNRAYDEGGLHHTRVFFARRGS